MNHKIIIIVTIAVVVIAIAFGAFWAVKKYSDNDSDFIIPISNNSIDSFEECAARYPVLESHPMQCNTPDGKHFVEELELPVKPPSEDDDEPDDVVAMPNPASVFCEEEGGENENRAFENGSAGFCLFEDGSECGQWAYFRGECKPGEDFCKDMCGDGGCDEVVCEAVGCPCAETPSGCPADCK